MHDVVEIIILRKHVDEDQRFVYPQQAAEYAIALNEVKPSLKEREKLESCFKQLLDKLFL